MHGPIRRSPRLAEIDGSLLPHGSDISHAGSRYRVTERDNPWGEPVGAYLIEVRRGEFWDNSPPLSQGDCWAWLRPLDAPPKTRDRPVLVEEIEESGARTWACHWLEPIELP